MSFFKLSKLLPDHDPTLSLSKIEIITKATEYIQQLKNENMQLIIDSDNITGAQKNEMNHLSERVANLLRRTRQLADLLQAADIPIPSEMPPHESEFPLKPPSKWSGRISKDTAKEILESIKKKREEKEKIHKEKQKIIKEKKNSNNLTKHKKAKSKIILKPSVNITHKKKCQTQDMLGLNLNVAPTTSNTATPLREINNALPEKNLSYPKTLTLPCTTISLVISNTKTSIVSVAKSNILTAPIMATGIQPVLERNPALSNLGPGTLILPDGRIMPVPPPAPTMLTAATQIIVNRPTQPAVIVMQNNLTSVKQNKTQRVLVPKPKAKDSTKTTFVNKVPIPAIKAHDTCIYVENSTDQCYNIATNVKKQKVSVKSLKNNSTVKIIEKITKTDVNIGINSDKLNKQKNIVVKVHSNQQKKSCKKRTNTEDSVPCKKIKVNEVIKNMDKSENKDNNYTSITNKQNKIGPTLNQNNIKDNEIDMDKLELLTNVNKTTDKELQPASHTEDEGHKEKKQNQPNKTDTNNCGNAAASEAKRQNESGDKLNDKNSNTSQINSDMAQTNFISNANIEIPYSESTNKNAIENSNQTNCANLNAICAKDSLQGKAPDNASSMNSSVVLNTQHSSFDAKSHGVLNNNEITRKTSNTLNTATNQTKAIISCPNKTDSFTGQQVTNVVSNTSSQNFLDPKMFTNNFPVQATQKTELGIVTSSQNYYSQQTNVNSTGTMGLHINQNHKATDVNNAVNNSSKQTSNDNIIINNNADITHTENLNCPDHAAYLSVGSNSQIYQTSTDSLSIMNSEYNMKANFSYQIGNRGLVDSSINTSNCSVLQANTNRTRNIQNEQSPNSGKFGGSGKQQANINPKQIRGSLDSSAPQTNTNSCTSMQTDHEHHTSTDFISPSNRNIDPCSSRMLRDSKYPMVSCTNHSISHPSNMHHAKGTSSLTDHSVQMVNNGATMVNQLSNHNRVPPTTISNSTDNRFHNVSNNHSVSHTLDQRRVTVSTNDLNQIDNSSPKPCKETLGAVDSSTLHQPNAHFTSQIYNTNMSNKPTQTVHQSNRISVGTFINTQTSQNDKSLCQGNIEYGNHPQSSLNDFRICSTNIDLMGNINTSNQNTVCQTGTSSSANKQTNSDFVSPSGTSTNIQRHSVNQLTIGETMGSSNIKPDSVCQANTNFRSPVASLNTHSNQSSCSTNTKGLINGSKNNNNQVQEDFRSSSYKCSTVQSNSSHQLNREAQSSGSQASMTFIGPTFSCANTSATNSNNTTVSNQVDKSVQLLQRDNQTVEANPLGNHLINQRADKDQCVSACNYNRVQKVKEGNVVSASQNTQSSTTHKSSQIVKKSSVQTEQKSVCNENLLKLSTAPQMPNCDVKNANKDYVDVQGRGKNPNQDKEKNKHLINNNNFNISGSKVISNIQDISFNDKSNDLGAKPTTKEQQVQCFSEDKTSKKEHQKQDFNSKKPDHEVSDSMKLQTCTENVFRDLNYRDRNSFIPINHCIDEMRLTDFSSDLFSSLQVPTGGQHPESISPTAAFLLAFPLVSTSKTSEMLAENENSDSQHATPTTILQIGNIDPPGSELYQSMENSLQFQNSIKTKQDDKTDKQGKFQQFEMNERISQNYTHFRPDESYEKNSCKQKKSNFMMLQDQELFMSCDKKSNSEKSCPYFSQTTGNFTGLAQNVQQNNSSNQAIGNPKKSNPTTNEASSHYPYNQPYYNLFPSNNEFSANVTSSLTAHTSNESQKVESQSSNQNNFSSILPWSTPVTTTPTSHLQYTTPTTTTPTSHLQYTTPYTTFSQKTQPYVNQSNGKQNHLQNFERKDKQNSTLPKFSTNFQFGNNARNDLPQYHASENNLNFKDSKLKKSKSNQTNQHRPPVNWMTTPDIRPVVPDHMTALLPDVIYSSKEIDLNPSQNTILNSCSNIPSFNLPTSISNNQTFYPNSHYSGIDLPLDLPSFPEISVTKQSRTNQQSAQYSWSPNKASIPLLPHLDSHNLAIPSTLPTLVGDLALGTNTGPPTPAENFKSYPLPNNFVGSTVKRCDTKPQECQKNQNKPQDKDCLIPTNNERKNSTRTDYCKTHSNQSTNTTGSFLSVSQLVEQVKSDRNIQRRSSKQPCKSQSAQKRSNAHNDKHNMKNITPLNNYPSNNNNNVMPQRKNENHFLDDRNKNLGYPGIFPSSNIPHSWQAGKMNTNSVQFKGGSYSAESLIGANSDTNLMNHDNIPEISQFPSNQFNNQYNNSSVNTNNTYGTDFPQNIQHNTEYSQTQQQYQNCFNFTSQNSIYTSTTTAPFLESDYQLNLDSSYVFHHPSTNTSCQTNQTAKDRSVQSTRRNNNNKRRDDYNSLPINQSTPFLQTPQIYPPSSQYVNSRNNSGYQPALSCVSGSNTTSSLAHHGTTTLTNFNLTTIFPEMNVDDKRAVSGSNNYHTNNSKHDVNTSVAQPGVRTDSLDNRLPSMRPGVRTDSLDNRLPSMGPGFNNIVHSQQSGASLNPPSSSHFTAEGFNNASSTGAGFSGH